MAETQYHEIPEPKADVVATAMDAIEQQIQILSDVQVACDKGGLEAQRRCYQDTTRLQDQTDATTAKQNISKLYAWGTTSQGRLANTCNLASDKIRENMLVIRDAHTKQKAGSIFRIECKLNTVYLTCTAGSETTEARCHDQSRVGRSGEELGVLQEDKTATEGKRDGHARGRSPGQEDLSLISISQGGLQRYSDEDHGVPYISDTCARYEQRRNKRRKCEAYFPRVSLQGIVHGQVHEQVLQNIKDKLQNIEDAILKIRILLHSVKIILQDVTGLTRYSMFHNNRKIAAGLAISKVYLRGIRDRGARHKLQHVMDKPHDVMRLQSPQQDNHSLGIRSPNWQNVMLDFIIVV